MVVVVAGMEVEVEGWEVEVVGWEVEVVGWEVAVEETEPHPGLPGIRIPRWTSPSSLHFGTYRPHRRCSSPLGAVELIPPPSSALPLMQALPHFGEGTPRHLLFST